MTRLVKIRDVDEQGRSRSQWVDESEIDGDAVQVVILSQSETLTDAQVKALPTTGIEIVPAVANMVIYPLFAHARMEWVADYGNIDAGALLSIFIGLNSEVLWALRQDLGSSVTALLAGGGPDGTHAFFQPKFIPGDPTPGSIANYYDSDLANKAVRVSMNNGSSGNLTSGNAGNSLKVTVFYTLIEI